MGYISVRLEIKPLKLSFSATSLRQPSPHSSIPWSSKVFTNRDHISEKELIAGLETQLSATTTCLFVSPLTVESLLKPRAHKWSTFQQKLIASLRVQISLRIQRKRFRIYTTPSGKPVAASILQHQVSHEYPLRKYGCLKHSHDRYRINLTLVYYQQSQLSLQMHAPALFYILVVTFYFCDIRNAIAFRSRARSYSCRHILLLRHSKRNHV